ncbi:MAG: integration host factor subunit alpha [Cellvibrionales bacterium]|nr:integration host factor subunit alpha [Cellvibrionales bacterium]
MPSSKRTSTALTKADLAEMLFAEIGLNKRESREIVEMFFAELCAALAACEPIKLSGFGNFELRRKRPRPGRNPKTGEEIPIAARTVVSFRPGRKLRNAVENKEGQEETQHAGTAAE